MRFSPYVYRVSVPPLTFAGFLRRLAIWAVVCAIAAGPSFYWALLVGPDEAQLSTICLGVLIVIGLYTTVSCSSLVRRLNAQPFVRSTFFCAYGLRIVYSALFPLWVVFEWVLDLRLPEPLGLYLFGGDFLSGACANIFLEWALQTRDVYNEGLIGVFLLTLTQAALVSFFTAVLMVPIYLAQRLFRKMPAPPPSAAEICVRCGYDLRASTGSCPECGHAITVPASGGADSD